MSRAPNVSKVVQILNFHHTHYAQQTKPSSLPREGQQGGRQEGVLMEIRAAWPHKDGKGFDVVLDVLLLDGRMKLREEMEKEAPAQ
jgi:hypothetical protein